MANNRTARLAHQCKNRSITITMNNLTKNTLFIDVMRKNTKLYDPD